MAGKRDLLGSKRGEAVEGSLRVWHEDERLLVEFGPFDRSTLRAAEEESQTAQTLLDRMKLLLDRELNASSGDDPAMLADLTEADWLEAELLVLQKEAIARADSLDATLAYVSERCAPVLRN